MSDVALEPVGPPPRPLGASPARWLAAQLGVTEGQAYTLVIGLVAALVTAAIGIPPTLRDRVEPAAVARPAAPPEAGPEQTADVPASDVAEPASPLPSVVAPPARPRPAPPPVESVSPPAVAGPPPPAATGPVYADGGQLGDVEMVAAVGEPGVPAGVAVDAATGAFFVATDNGGSRGSPGPSKVLRYSPGGALAGEYVIQGQPASRGRGVTGLVHDGKGHLFALDASTARVLRLDLATSAQAVFATIPDLPPCTIDAAARCELSPRDGAPVIHAAAFGPAGDLFVADAGQGILWMLDRFGDAAIWDKATDYLSPDGTGPAGVQFDASGDLLLAVTSSLVAITGAVYRIPVQPDGTAGPREELFRSKPNEAPSGIAAGVSGRVYVALSGVHQLLVLDADGAMVTTVASPSFDTPFGVAFRGRSLLVTNQSAARNDPARWSVVRVAVEEAGVPQGSGTSD